MKRAFITGITGQDGSYLAELLLAKGYEVHGWSAGVLVQPRADRPPAPHDAPSACYLHYGDLTDGVSLVNLLREIGRDEVYNLGAQSHVKVSFEMPEYTGVHRRASARSGCSRRSAPPGSTAASTRRRPRRCSARRRRRRTRRRRSTRARRTAPRRSTRTG